MGANQSYRFLERHGQDVTLTTYTAGATDSYGDPSWSGSEQTVKARVQLGFGRGGDIVVDAAGEERAVGMEAWIKDTVSVAVDPDRPPEVALGGVTYEVVVVDDVQDNGLKRLVCARTR